MRYLIICKTLDDEILNWKELHYKESLPDAISCDPSAVLEAFDLGTLTDDTDIVEIYGEYETGIQMVCQICF